LGRQLAPLLYLIRALHRNGVCECSILFEFLLTHEDIGDYLKTSQYPRNVEHMFLKGHSLSHLRWRASKQFEPDGSDTMIVNTDCYFNYYVSDGLHMFPVTPESTLRVTRTKFGL
jgi:hypothetical protein